MGMGGVLVRSPGLLGQEWRWEGRSGTIWGKWYHLQRTNRKTGPRKALSSCRRTIRKQDLAVGCREEASG